MLIPTKLKSLHFAARPRVVAHYLGQILFVLGALNLVPAAVAFADGMTGIALRYLAVIAAFVLIGTATSRLHVEAEVQRNEAMVISALAFVLPPFLLAIPLTGYGIGYLDAFFEAVSGITTTGLSAVGSAEHMPYSFHFARAWMQWLGGLGVIVLCLAFLVEPGIAAKPLGFSPREAEEIGGSTKKHARRRLLSYGALTMLGVGLLALLGMQPQDALIHSLAAISTGGFSSHDASLATLPIAARFGVMGICLAGAVPFFLYTSIWKRQWRVIFADVQLRALLVAIAIVVIVLFALMLDADRSHPWIVLQTAVVTAISAQTTAGFSVVPYDQLGNAVNAVLIAAMIVGGGVGSTAGGIKVLRLLILVRFIQIVLLRCSVPVSAHVPTRLGGRPLDAREIEASMAVVFAFFTIMFVSTMVFLAYGKDPMRSIFEVVSAVGTVGLSSGLSGPDLAPGLKAVLCFDMLAGRLEILALLVLLFPPTWIGRRRISA